MKTSFSTLFIIHPVIHCCFLFYFYLFPLKTKFRIAYVRFVKLTASDRAGDRERRHRKQSTGGQLLAIAHISPTAGDKLN